MNADGIRLFALTARHGLGARVAARLVADPCLDRPVVTDSIPPFRIDPGVASQKLAVLPSAPLFAEAIRRIHEGGSIVELLASGV